ERGVEVVHLVDERRTLEAAGRLVVRIARERGDVAGRAGDPEPVESRRLEDVAEIEEHGPPGEQAHAAPEEGGPPIPDIVVEPESRRPQHVSAGRLRRVDAPAGKENRVLGRSVREVRDVELEAGGE